MDDFRPKNSKTNFKKFTSNLKKFIYYFLVIIGALSAGVLLPSLLLYLIKRYFPSNWLNLAQLGYWGFIYYEIFNF